MNAIYFGVIIAVLVGVILMMGGNIWNIVINIIIRCLTGIVFISVANYLLCLWAVNIEVKINEISMFISGVLGISGVIAMYFFQWFLTIV